jgi:hypothetical protein
MALFSSTGPSPPSTNPPPPSGGPASIPASAAPGSTTPDGASGGGDDEELELIPGRKPSQDWELDCYSRPVVAAGGKKLWEVLLTDATGSFRYRKTLPSNQVNSKELRKTVEALIEDPRIETKPSTIRFFRGAMFNSKYPLLCRRHRKKLNQCLFGFPVTSSSSQLLTPLLCSVLSCCPSTTFVIDVIFPLDIVINIALSDLDVVGRPSRCTYAIAQWLEERHRDVYPKMEGCVQKKELSDLVFLCILLVRFPIEICSSME